MKERTQHTTDNGPVFTSDEHLWVQEQIEKRAYELWRAGGCSGADASDNWLKAEREVVEQFILGYARRAARLVSRRTAGLHSSDPSKGTGLKTRRNDGTVPVNSRRGKEADSPRRAGVSLLTTAECL